MKEHLVINLIGGPGSGKSTVMAGVFYWLKKHGVNCEIATEYTKDKVWEEDYKAMDDQLYIIGKQFHRISRMIDKVDIVIMDTSLLSSIIYDKKKSQAIKNTCIEAYKSFNNMVFFVDRGGNGFHQEGRRENYEESRVIDTMYLRLMDELEIPFVKVTNENAVDTIISQLKAKGYVKDE